MPNNPQRTSLLIIRCLSSWRQTRRFYHLTTFKSYVLKRVLLAFPIIMGVLTITFILSRVVPSNPALLLLGTGATQEHVEAITQSLGLDKPIQVQYVLY